MLDKIGIAADEALAGTPAGPTAGGGMDPFPPLLHFYRDRDGTAADASDRLGLLALIKPALFAGLRTIGHFDATRSRLLDHFDGISFGVVITDFAGRSLYENPAIGRLCPEAYDRERLRALSGDIARSLRPCVRRSAEIGTGQHRATRPHTSRGALTRGRKPDAALEPAAPSRTFCTARGSFRLHSSLLAPGTIHVGEAIMVSVEPLTPTPLSATDLREIYRLTPREIEVAQAIARSLATRTIAAELNIAYATARRHIEMVFLKLGVSTRALASAVLRGEQPPPRATR
jgi:DNA-binding CsgD family transcriptional regulator